MPSTTILIVIGVIVLVLYFKRRSSRLSGDSDDE
jgi:hypothetical protein